MDTLTQFGTYQIVRKIGAGGMADVYEAVRVGLENFQTRVALKCIQPSMTRDERFVKMFINEAHLGSQLHHPNIIQIQDFNKFNDTYYIAMEYVEGVDLSRIIKRLNARGISFPATVVIDLALQVLAGLGHAHDARRGDGSPMNIIHRDVKPSNFLITASGMVKIGDFGIAKAANAAHNLSLTGDSLKGTINYMSPEQIDGVTLTPASDLFGVAAIIFEMLTLRALFDGPTMSSVLLKIAMVNIEGDLKLVSSRYPVFIPVLRRGLAREVRDRYSNASDFSAELRRLREELSEGLSLREFLAMHKDHLFAPYGTQPGEQEEKDGPLSIAVTPPDGVHRKTLSYATGVEPGAFDLVAGDGMEGFDTDPEIVPSSFGPGTSSVSSPWQQPVSDSSGVLSVFNADPRDVPPWKDDLGSVAQALLPSDELDDAGMLRPSVADEETRVIPSLAARSAPVVAVPADEDLPEPVPSNRKPLLIGAGLVSLLLLGAAVWVLSGGSSVAPSTVPQPSVASGSGTDAGAGVKAPVEPAVKAAQLSIQSTPPGARISVGGVALGALTPTTLPLPLDKTTVTVQLELSGYKTFTQDLPYQPGQALELKPSLVPGESSLTVISTPAGGRIFLDQKDTRQVTPFTFQKLPAGEPMLVAVRAKGFDVYRSEVKLEDGVPARVEATLQKGGAVEGAVGDSEKPGASEPVDKPTAPVKPTTPVKSAADTPEPGKKPVVDTAPPPEKKPGKQGGEGGAPGELVLNTKPPDAEVFVDGKRHGEVPATVRLNPGMHRIEFRPVNGSKPKSFPVQLGAGERLRILWTLDSDEPKIRSEKLE